MAPSGIGLLIVPLAAMFVMAVVMLRLDQRTWDWMGGRRRRKVIRFPNARQRRRRALQRVRAARHPERFFGGHGTVKGYRGQR
jgi:hypothetical protein